MEKSEMHLDIYKDKSILYDKGEIQQEFIEGPQDEFTLRNNAKIRNALDQGFLEDLITNVYDFDFANLDIRTKKLIDSIVNKVTSEVGRALVGLTFLQLTIKAIEPTQSVRLHKGSTRNGAFSWRKGISLRTIDKHYNTPFLRKYNLVNLNADGLMMTRSLAENYPYSQLYKAEMKGPFHEWIEIVDSLENGSINPIIGLNYLLTVLINRSNKISTLGNHACDLVKEIKDISFAKTLSLLVTFFEQTKYSARAFEVVIHSFMQAYQEMNLTDFELVPMSQMRSANKKHGNIGDIELKDGKIIVESWDAKYGKPYLYEEIGELKDKLESHPEVLIAGFIVNKDAIKSEDILEEINNVSYLTNTEIKLYNFSEWVDYKINGLTENSLKIFGLKWLTATIESFSRKRIDLAPIDEPCDNWLNDLIILLEEAKNS